MEVQEILEEARKSVGAKGVYAEPYVHNGLTVIPAAAIAGGAGGGTGDGDSGRGGGFGVRSRPTGAWVIENGAVRWKTALDLNRIVFGAELVALAGVFAARTIFGPKKMSQRRAAKLARLNPTRALRRARLPRVHLAMPHVPAIRR